MADSSRKPRILIVTPEVRSLPEGMGGVANGFSAKAGGLADVSAALINALFEQGADVHVALPDYRSIFGSGLAPMLLKSIKAIRKKLPGERIHLAEDRAFFYLQCVYSSYGAENTKISLAFQREVINHIVSQVQPDLIHCNDWMTCLIPAMARQLNIPCLLTVHNIHSVKAFMSQIEDRGIDAASFWRHLYFDQMPENYESARDNDPVDFLASGIFAAHFVNTVSPSFLQEIARGQHVFIQENIRRELTHKANAGCAMGILNAPDSSYDPSSDNALIQKYSADDQAAGKKKNKRFLQETLGLIRDARAPIFFWPSRLDAVQKGCQLLADILYHVVSKYWNQKFQIVFVADGEFQEYFKNIVRYHDFFDRVAICGFDERLARLAYGASDFVLMPSLFEPCGLPQMIGPLYGSLPVARDTGGIHDTVTHMDVSHNTGNGFLFETFDANGLFWAIDQSMHFYKLPRKIRDLQVKRIMEQSAQKFTHEVTALQYIELYEKMLNRPLLNDSQPDTLRLARA